MLYGLTTILQPAEERAAPAAGEAHVVAAHRGAPAGFVDDRFHAKAGKVVGQFAQALFDVLGERRADTANAAADTPLR